MPVSEDGIPTIIPMIPIDDDDDDDDFDEEEEEEEDEGGQELMIT
jgi:hypothetical protein